MTQPLKELWPIDSPMAYPIKNRDDLKKYKMPDLSIPQRMAENEVAVVRVFRDL